jgi:hypothetical protein
MGALYNLHWLVASQPWESGGIVVQPATSFDWRGFLPREPLSHGNAQGWQTVQACLTEVEGGSLDVVLVLFSDEMVAGTRGRPEALFYLRRLLKERGNIVVVSSAGASRRLRRSLHLLDRDLVDAGFHSIRRFYVEWNVDEPVDIVPAAKDALLAWDTFRPRSKVSRVVRSLLVRLQLSQLLFTTSLTVASR